MDNYILLPVILIVLIAIIIFLKNQNIENYSSLRKMGLSRFFNRSKKAIGFRTGERHSSVKYRGHRYDRRKIRSHQSFD